MAAPAGFEIQVAAERSLAVMTSRAGVVSGGEVFEGPRRADLSFLRQSRRVVVTVAATQMLAPAVLGVTERTAERGRVS